MPHSTPFPRPVAKELSHDKLCWTMIVLAVCMIGVGFYRGWFVLSGHTRDTGSHKVDVKLTVDTDKMKEDAESVQDKAKKLRVRTRNASGRLSNAITLVRNSGPLPRKPGESGQECQRELLDSQRPTLTTRFGNLFEKDVDHEKALHSTRRSGDLGRRSRILSRLVCAFV